MIPSLYQQFRYWTASLHIFSDPHFEDADCNLMDPDWITPEEQVARINRMVMPLDTLILLGDIGNPGYVKQLRGYKVLIMGNHDQSRARFEDYFDEIYEGPLFIGEKILLSHEPISLPFALNIHGHDHNGTEYYQEGCKHINVAANVCGYQPINLGKLIKKGILADIPSIHRLTIDQAAERKAKKNKGSAPGSGVLDMCKQLKVIKWMSWKEAEPIPDASDDGNVIKAVIDSIRAGNFHFSGEYHQNGKYGVPLLNNGTKFCASMREWGEIMAKAYPEENLIYLDYYMGGETLIPPYPDEEGEHAFEQYGDLSGSK